MPFVLSETLSLVVSIWVFHIKYVLKDGELQDPTENGISYEVIKSVTSTVDAFGCVKTTVYISVVLLTS